MERRRITCPESAHLEEIEFERTPFGLVIAGCSRFSPPCAVKCAGECARRLDRRDRAEHQERVLVAYADGTRTRLVADPLVRELARDHMTVEVADLDARGAPPPADYDAIVIGAAERFYGFSRAAIEYITEHRHALGEMPAFFYFVNRTGTSVQHLAGWRPTRAFGFPRHAHVSVTQLAAAVADELPAE